jgi:hypothetical protein
MQPRRPRQTRKAQDWKKPRIKPYDRSTAEDRFRKEFMDRVDSKESEIRQLTEQNEELSRSLSQCRGELEERRIRIDDRSIGMISFQAVINCWSRFLDRRQTDARQNLAHPLDDIDCLEAAVDAMEQGARCLASQSESFTSRVLEDQVRDESESLRLLVHENSLRRASFRVRQLHLRNQLRFASADPTLAVDFPARVPIPAVDATRFRGALEREAAKLAEKQRRLDQLEIEMRVIEEESSAFFAPYANRSREHAKKIRTLAQTFHSKNELEIKVQTAKEVVDGMRLDFVRMKDGDTEERRAMAFVAGLRARVEREAKALERLRDQVAGMQLMAKKQHQSFRRRRNALKQEMERCQESVGQAAAKRGQVEKLEEQVLRLQLKLNLKWKEAHAMCKCVPPAAIFGERSGRSPRADEMIKVIQLVTSDREQ